MDLDDMYAFFYKFYFQSLYFLPYEKVRLEVAICHQHFDIHLFMQGEVCHCKKSAKELLVPITQSATNSYWFHRGALNPRVNT